MKLLLLVTLMLALATSHRIRTRHNSDTANELDDLMKQAIKTTIEDSAKEDHSEEVDTHESHHKES